MVSILTFLHKVTVQRAQLEGWSGKLTGLRDKREKAEITVVGSSATAYSSTISSEVLGSDSRF